MNYLIFIFTVSVFLYDSSNGFDYWMIAQTWPPGFCMHEQCAATVPKPYKFTVHGLWPSTYRWSPPLQCTTEKLDNSTIKPIDGELERVWPSYFGKNGEFWIHEWWKHGTCSNLQQLDYFKLTLDIYARNDLAKILENAGISHGALYPIHQVISVLRASLGVRPQLKCIKGDLVEVRLCLNTNTIPQYINCANTRYSDCEYKKLPVRSLRFP
ncbi:unnamed protein product [Sphenostylis stenocarpa]|uniref:Uncharacterized protein n=1 Tax=Sphenostylis stenocarpa TaxID=92480 RepID=A0AA86VZP4_9FABA|nr:unnamed protein product [Sphenostylis stenocarpa]